MEEMLYVSLFPSFSLPLIFTFVAAGISHFLTSGKKTLMFSSNDIGFLFYKYISL